jgi:hypothetical protein
MPRKIMKISEIIIKFYYRICLMSNKTYKRYKKAGLSSPLFYITDAV